MCVNAGFGFWLQRQPCLVAPAVLGGGAGFGSEHYGRPIYYFTVHPFKLFTAI